MPDYETYYVVTDDHGRRWRVVYLDEDGGAVCVPLDTEVALFDCDEPAAAADEPEADEPPAPLEASE